jgi:hypothetical protein
MKASAALLMLGFAACAACAHQAPNLPPARADNVELAELAAEDQKVRSGGDVDRGPGIRTDDERRTRVMELIAAGAVVTPRDKFNAGLVLQHTGLTFCDGVLKSQSAENYLLAHHYFESALAAGLEAARGLSAMAIDRYLSFTKGIQKYGTNLVFNQETGKDEWVPIDRNTTDAERARYGIAPLATLLAQHPEHRPKGR